MAKQDPEEVLAELRPIIDEMMLFERLVIDITPFLDGSVNWRQLDNESQERYIDWLDRFGIFLREEDFRSETNSRGLFEWIVNRLEDALVECFGTPESEAESPAHPDAFCWRLVSELMRCVSNSLADGEEQRKLVVEKKPIIMDYYVGKILFLDAEDNEVLHLRTVSMARNLCLLNDEYTKRFSHLKAPMLDVLRRQDLEMTAFLGSAFVADLLTVHLDVSLDDLDMFVGTIWSLCEKVQDEKNAERYYYDIEGPLDDPILNVLANFIECLEIPLNEEVPLDFQHPMVFMMQGFLLGALDKLTHKTFRNKQMYMRRLMACIGGISAQRRNTNKNERKMCCRIIREAKNSYKIGAVLVVLSNSIDSREDALAVAKEISLQDLLKGACTMYDPVQVQGFSTIMRKLLNVPEALEINADVIKDLKVMLNRIHLQSTFFDFLYANFDTLLTKLFTVLPATIIGDLISDKELMMPVLTERDGTFSCLALAKVMASSIPLEDNACRQLWMAATRLKDNILHPEDPDETLSVFYLFQLAKAIGILLKNLETDGKKLDGFFKPRIIGLLKLIKPLKKNDDQESKNAINNGKFVATMLLSLLDKYSDTEKTEQDQQLETSAKEFLSL